MLHFSNIIKTVNITRLLLVGLLFVALNVGTVSSESNQVFAAETCYETCIRIGGSPGKCEDDCGGPPVDVFNPKAGPSSETFDFLNPLELGSKASTLSTPGGIISEILVFIFPLAGLVLFLMLVWGGFEILIGGANKKSIDTGKQRITSALTGFFLLFSSYWITQILEYIFGVAIL